VWSATGGKVASGCSELWLEPHKADDILAKSGLGYPRSSPVFIYPLGRRDIPEACFASHGSGPGEEFYSVVCHCQHGLLIGCAQGCRMATETCARDFEAARFLGASSTFDILILDSGKWISLFKTSRAWTTNRSLPDGWVSSRNATRQQGR
jgi:hypothetical protein